MDFIGVIYACKMDAARRCAVCKARGTKCKWNKQLGASLRARRITIFIY